MVPPLHTPYAHLVPPLALEDFRALERTISSQGQTEPVVIDEHGNVLSGHDCYAVIGERVRTRTMTGLTETEKRALVLTSVLGRQHMTLEEIGMLRDKQRRVARDLHIENPSKHTPASLAVQFGVGLDTITAWLKFTERHSSTVRSMAVERVRAGESLNEVARSLGLPRRTVSHWVNAGNEPSRPTASPASAPSRAPAPAGRPVENKRVEAIRRLRAGEASKDIARELGVPSSTLSGWREAAGIEPRRGKVAPSVLELHKEGLGTIEIARKLGVTGSAVSNQKTKMGISANNVSVKLWADIDHLATLLEGTELTVAALVERLAISEPATEQPEISRCISSLSKSKRTLGLLINALKQRRK